MADETQDPRAGFDQTNGQVAGLEGRPDRSAQRALVSRRVRFLNQILGAFGRLN